MYTCIYIYVYMYIYIWECVCITHTPGISISDLAIVLGPSCISFSTNIKEVCPPCDRPMPELPPMDEPPGWISDAEWGGRGRQDAKKKKQDGRDMNKRGLPWKTRAEVKVCDWSGNEQTARWRMHPAHQFCPVHFVSTAVAWDLRATQRTQIIYTWEDVPSAELLSLSPS